MFWALACGIGILRGVTSLEKNVTKPVLPLPPFPLKLPPVKYLLCFK